MDHLCLSPCPYPARCTTCGVCIETSGRCRECKIVREMFGDRPEGRRHRLHGANWTEKLGQELGIPSE